MTIRYTLALYGVLTLAAASHGQWTALPDITMPEFDGGYSFVIDDMIYVGHGNELRMYDPAAAMWSERADFPGVGASRNGACSFVVNNKAYVGMGFANGMFHTDLWQYDPGTNAWSAETSFPGPARGGSGTFVLGGKGYLCGGTSTGPQFADVYSYDPESNIWTLETSLPTGNRGFTTAWSVGGYGYVFGGYTGFGNETAQVHRYDPVTDSWSAMADYPGGGRQSSLAFVFGTQVIVGMGHVGFTTAGTIFYQYDTGTNTWAPHGDFSGWPGGARIAPVGAVVGSTAYLGTGATLATFTPNGDWWSNSIAVGLDELESAETRLLVHPVPSGDQVTISWGMNGIGEIALFNTTGTLVFSTARTGTSTLLDLSGLPAGPYMARYRNNEGIVRTGRILKH
ncbi:MAG: T9SS type A sorting domain-containing protein [Flavobacteriales bacterium]|nr:MAG: T9SS type A sorting domain-containing protein [Flavobacteriales bacterium]